jgi:hypothetical protein
MAVPCDEAIAWNRLIFHSEIAAAVGDELVDLFERVFVQQKFDPLARRELAFFMLPGLPFRPATLFGGFAPAAQFFQAVHRDYCSGRSSLKDTDKNVCAWSLDISIRGAVRRAAKTAGVT